MRNPAHELRARQIIRALSPKPVTCAYELSSKLDAPRRALTAALNARLTPQIRHLIEALSRVLAQESIDAPLMVVKGDGSLMKAEVALEYPVETILSGPAASVVGASFLTGLEDFVVSDMGGTTTDVAVVSGGRPVIRDEGALIGVWRTMVETVDVRTSGLGGDSEVHFDRQLRLRVGPRKAMPLSLMAQSFPSTLTELRSIAELAAPSRFRDPIRFSQSRSRRARASVGARAPSVGRIDTRAAARFEPGSQLFRTRCAAPSRRWRPGDARSLHSERRDARARPAAGVVPRGGRNGCAHSRDGGAQRSRGRRRRDTAGDLRAHLRARGTRERPRAPRRGSRE